MVKFQRQIDSCSATTLPSQHGGGGDVVLRRRLLVRVCCQWLAGASARNTTNATAAQAQPICNAAFTMAASDHLPCASGQTATAVLHRRTSHSRRRQHHVTPSCSLPIVYPAARPAAAPQCAPAARRQRLGGCCHWHCLLPRRVLQPSVQPIVTRPEHSASACARQHMQQVLCRRRHSLLHADHLLLFLLRLRVTIH